jgi:hypothetical protein
MIGFYKFADVDVAARKKKGGFFPNNSALDIVVQGLGKPLLCSYGVGIMLAGSHREPGADKLWPRDTAIIL